jgi:Fe-S-cluster containining protein
MKNQEKIGLWLTDNLSIMFKELPESEKGVVANLLMQTIHSLKKLKDLHPEGSKSIANTVHVKMDEYAVELLKDHPHAKEISCSKGCFSCCLMNVDISLSEADLLLNHCEYEGIEIDFEKLKRQSDYNTESWQQQPIKDRKCVFLSNEGTCKVYKHRPASCRKHLVISKPELCDIEKHKGAKVGRLNIWQVEVMASALYNTYESGTMANMLLTAKKQLTIN